MAKVLHGVETLQKISIAWVGCTNITDRRQTDGRRHIANVNMSSRSLKSARVDSLCFHWMQATVNVGRNVAELSFGLHQDILWDLSGAKCYKFLPISYADKVEVGVFYCVACITEFPD